MSPAARTFVAPVSFGIGDLVVSLPVIQRLVADAAGSSDETWLVTRSDSQVALAERIEGLAGTVAEANVTHLAHRPDDRLVDLRDHPLQRDHWWGSPEFDAAHGPLTINDILGRIAADYGVSADFSAPVPLVSTHARPDAAGRVLLVADSDGTSKHWSTDRWAAVADILAHHGEHVAVVTVDESAHPLVDRGIDRLVAPSLGDVVDVLTAGRAVVGVDTGLTHIAAQQGTPTVTLSRLPAVYFRDWTHTRLVAGTSCDPACRRVEEHYAYHDRVDLTSRPRAPRTCPSASSCLGAIGPESVLVALGELC